MRTLLIGLAAAIIMVTPTWAQTTGAGTTTGVATGNPSGGSVGSIDSLSSGAHGKPGAFAKDSSATPQSGDMSPGAAVGSHGRLPQDKTTNSMGSTSAGTSPTDPSSISPK